MRGLGEEYLFFIISYQITAPDFSLLPAKSYLVYIMLSIILFKSALCIDLACFGQLPCAINVLFPVLIQKVFKGVSRSCLYNVGCKAVPVVYN